MGLNYCFLTYCPKFQIMIEYGASPNSMFTVFCRLFSQLGTPLLLFSLELLVHLRMLFHRVPSMYFCFSLPHPIEQILIGYLIQCEIELFTRQLGKNTTSVAMSLQFPYFCL